MRAKRCFMLGLFTSDSSANGWMFFWRRISHFLVTRTCEKGVKNVCRSERHHHHGGGCGCGCGCGGGLKRRFFSREEKIAKLEGYLKDLKAEAESVEAKIRCLKDEK
jgi:hypothetical protein